jgi:hypothetical protein
MQSGPWYGQPVAPVAHFSGPWYGQPVAPVNPFGFQQVFQGLQLVQGFLGSPPGQQLLHEVHLLVGDLPGRRTQQPTPSCNVSSDVVETLKRVDDALEDIVKKTNALTQGDEKTKKFRDPKYPEVNKPIEVVKPKGGTTATDGVKLKVPQD